MSLARHPLCAVLCFWAVLVGACSTAADPQAHALWDNPAPKPDYLWDIFFGMDSQCVSVNAGFFAGEAVENGDLKLTDVVDKVRFTLDGQAVAQSGIGNDRFAIYGCFQIVSLSEGLHTASITLTDFSGGEANYSWAFNVKGRLAEGSDGTAAAHVDLPSGLVQTLESVDRP